MKLKIFIAFLCAVLSMTACGQEQPIAYEALNPAQTADYISLSPPPTPQPNLQDSEMPPDTEPVGIAFVDPIFEMMLFINNVEWTFYRDRNTDQVYFFNHINPSEDNLISITAFPFSGDTSQEAARLWNEMRESHRRSPMADSFAYQDKQAIQVGEDGQYAGYLYSFEAIWEDTLLILNALFWSAGDMMYICTASALEQDAKEVQGVLDGFLGSFISMAELSLPDTAPMQSADSEASVAVGGQSID